MKKVYPVFLSPVEGHYLVHIPDMDIMTEGVDLVDAIEMAGDAIGVKGITMEDLGQELPAGSVPGAITVPEGQILTYVVVDFASYRMLVDSKAVRKNVSIPSGLNVKAEEAGVNFSKVLQEALVRVLDIKSMKFTRIARAQSA